ncbi:hypothetical protein GH714_004838 [Hevea brasiliensis]|uniref:Rx N-terminal domain-containing protein n=1 Tax=Hevea brasiliensis TaxID=3981 RepID=A0A6A6KXP1_HEVBR|nr:hypothetical protein GH714_004838 [Hevea brasiliensis]
MRGRMRQSIHRSVEDSLCSAGCILQIWKCIISLSRSLASIMAESIISFAVQRITDLLIQEALFLNGVSDEVQDIQTELRRMQCFLKDADSRLNEDESVHNWVSEIRDLAYEAEDVIEHFALKVASRRREGTIYMFKRFLCMLDEGLTSYNFGCKIRTLTAKISNLTRSLETYGIRDLRNTGSSSIVYPRQQLRRSYSHAIERHIIRREESIKQLVEYLVKEKKSCQFVSVWGMGGLGKTTLAKDIYHHNEVRSHFDYFAWSCISSNVKQEMLGKEFYLNSSPPL